MAQPPSRSPFGQLTYAKGCSEQASAGRWRRAVRGWMRSLHGGLGDVQPLNGAATGATLCPCPRTRGKVRKGVWTACPDSSGQVRKRVPTRQARKRRRLRCPKQGAGGAAPAGGTASPPVSKNVGGWAGGTTAHAKPDPSLMEGAGQDKTIRPHRRADPGVRGPCHSPLQNTNNCAMISP